MTIPEIEAKIQSLISEHAEAMARADVLAKSIQEARRELSEARLVADAALPHVLVRTNRAHVSFVLVKRTATTLVARRPGSDTEYRFRKSRHGEGWCLKRVDFWSDWTINADADGNPETP